MSLSTYQEDSSEPSAPNVECKPKRVYKTLSPDAKEIYRRMKSNTIALVEYSNACPFISHYDQYRCFYCRHVFPDMRSLRIHTHKEHSVPCLQLNSGVISNGKLLMVDITDLKCRLCGEDTSDLYKLKLHLSLTHQKLLNHESNDGIIPFRLTGESYDCLHCEASFSLFQVLNRHMNSHYGDKVCDICGANFLSSGRLKSHKIIHTSGSFPCNSCEKVFPSHAKLRCHEKRMHLKLPRYKCPKCPENFNEYYLRITHMYNVHDIDPPQHKCDVCDQTFQRPYLVLQHKKKHHVLNAQPDWLNTRLAGEANPI